MTKNGNISLAYLVFLYALSADLMHIMHIYNASHCYTMSTSGYATWFTAGGAIRIAHYDVIDDVITRKL